MKARKIPIYVEFEYFTLENMERAFTFCSRSALPDYDEYHNPVIRIITLEGMMTAELGDYIIKGVNGEFYPVKPDIFEKTYEIINDPTPDKKE